MSNSYILPTGGHKNLVPVGFICKEHENGVLVKDGGRIISVPTLIDDQTPVHGDLYSQHQVETILSTLEHTLNNFEALLAGKPVRDAEETIAEANKALGRI